MRSKKFPSLFMFLDGVIVEEVKLNYNNLNSSEERTQLQYSEVDRLTEKHKKLIESFKVKPKFEVRGSFEIENIVIADEKVTLNKIDHKQEEYIRENRTKITVKQIAFDLQLSQSDIYFYLNANKLAFKKIAMTNGEAPVKFQRPKAEYSNRSSMGYASGHEKIDE